MTALNFARTENRENQTDDLNWPGIEKPHTMKIDKRFKSEYSDFEKKRLRNETIVQLQSLASTCRGSKRFMGDFVTLLDREEDASSRFTTIQKTGEIRRFVQKA